METRYGLLIGGDEVAAIDGGWFTSTDPANGEPLAEFARARAEDVTLAVAAARKALDDTWRRTAPRERGRLLQRVADTITSRIDELAEWETRDCGKRLSLARADVQNAARYFEFFGNLAAAHGGQHIPIDARMLDVTVREPFGVSAQINAWNFPLSMAARSMAAALAAGNVVVLKTSELAPLTTAMLGRLFTECDMPRGVLNLLHGYGPECGADLVVAEVDIVTFTGSVATGVQVARAAARSVTPCVLELGGKSAAVIFADADLDEAARQLARAVVDSNGQCCDLPSRAIVHESIHDEFVTRVADHFASMSWGPGAEDRDWGPLINSAQLDRVAGMIQRARGDSAAVVEGGAARSHRMGGAYFEPTILTDVRPDMEIAQEEVFGPVVCVLPFSGEADAVKLANGTAYGLACFVWTADVGRAVRMAWEMRAGQVFINCFGSGDPVVTPFGGVGRSGYGREKGALALDTYSQIKNVCIAGSP